MPERDQKTPVGADLIIPVAAAAYAVYYVASVADFPFEAQISGEPVFTYDPKGYGSEDFQALTREVLRHG